jgi:hypothetical protein
LRTDAYGYPMDQKLVFDICGTGFDEHWHQHILPDSTFQSGTALRGVRQDLLFASEDGRTATNDSSQELKGTYYRQLRHVLGEHAAWPLDFESIHRDVKARFAAIRASGQTIQEPIHCVLEVNGGDSDEIEIRPTATAYAAGPAIQTPSLWRRKLDSWCRPLHRRRWHQGTSKARKAKQPSQGPEGGTAGQSRLFGRYMRGRISVFGGMGS